MLLADWLKIPGKDGKKRRKRDLARRIGVSPIMVTYYASGKAWPGRDKIEAIVRETRGQVTANDFLSDETRARISGVRARRNAPANPASASHA